jgi:hypothetical protein
MLRLFAVPILVLSVPDEGYSRNTLYSLKFIPAFLLQWYGQKKKDINTDNDLQNSAQEYNDWEALNIGGEKIPYMSCILNVYFFVLIVTFLPL